MDKATLLPGRFNLIVLLQIPFAIFWDYEMCVCQKLYNNTSMYFLCVKDFIYANTGFCLLDHY